MNPIRSIQTAALAVVLAALGCDAPQPRQTQLPDPELQTRARSPRVAARPAPPRPAPTVYQPNVPAKVTQSAPPRTDVGPLDTAALTPPRGIQRGKWNVIVVHHSANPNDSPQSMHMYHLVTRGWDHGLGYHFAIGNGVRYGDGKVYAGPRWRDQETGAHCKAGAGNYFGVRRPDNFFNEHGIGICLIGNFEGQPPTAKQLQSLEQLIAYLCGETGISPNRVYGHGEVTGKTACPGRVLRGKLAQVRRGVAQRLAWSTDYSGAPDISFWFDSLNASGLEAGVLLDPFACAASDTEQPDAHDHDASFAAADPLSAAIAASVRAW